MKEVIRLTCLSCLVLLPMSFTFAQTELGLNQAKKKDVQMRLVLGKNFGSLEIWGDGKHRRWMTNDARLIIKNSQTQTRTINLRFVAESFFQERGLDILFEDELIEKVSLPPAPLFIVVVKNLKIPPGEKSIIFHCPEGPENIDARLGTGDKRSGAFSQRPAQYDWLTADENEAYDLQREGRFSEAIEIYQKGIIAKSVDPSTYIWLGLSLLIVNQKEEAARVFQQVLTLRGWGLKAIVVRRSARRLTDYLTNSDIVNHLEEDQGLSLRSTGEIARVVELYQKILKENPQDLYAHFWLSLIYFVAERPEEAVQHWNKATGLASRTDDAKFFREVKFYQDLAIRSSKIVSRIFKD